jgi:hypothetical protein
MRISLPMKILLLVLIASFANSTKFFFGVIPRNMKCLGEYLTENTVGNKLINE